MILMPLSCSGFGKMTRAAGYTGSKEFMGRYPRRDGGKFMTFGGWVGDVGVVNGRLISQQLRGICTCDNGFRRDWNNRRHWQHRTAVLPKVVRAVEQRSNPGEGAPNADCACGFLCEWVVSMGGATDRHQQTSKFHLAGAKWILQKYRVYGGAPRLPRLPTEDDQGNVMLAGNGVEELLKYEATL